MMFAWVGKGEFYSLKGSVHYHMCGAMFAVRSFGSCCGFCGCCGSCGFFAAAALLPGLPLSPCCRWRPAILSQVAYIEIVETKVTQSQIHAWSRLALFTTDNCAGNQRALQRCPGPLMDWLVFFASCIADWFHCWGIVDQCQVHMLFLLIVAVSPNHQELL